MPGIEHFLDQPLIALADKDDDVGRGPVGLFPLIACLLIGHVERLDGAHSALPMPS
jgi:hypothetical protein